MDVNIKETIYICYFAKLQNAGKLHIAFIKTVLIDVVDVYLNEQLGIERGGYYEESTRE